MVGDRHQRHVVKAPVDRLQLRQIEPAVQRRERRHAHTLQQWISEVIQMRVNDVELVRTARDDFQFHEDRCEVILDGRIQTQRARPDRHELTFGLAVTGCK